VQDGEDINALYPYLSQFMGHSCYADTDYYLSLVEDFYPICCKIKIPKVAN
jgi:hypothetical protein